MNVRVLESKDIEEIRELHEKFYSHLEFPDFLNDCLFAFVVTDEFDDIVIAGKIRPIAEVILVTNKNKNRTKIGRALIEARNVSLYIGNKFKLGELIAFVKNNDGYIRHLLKHGFYARSSALGIQVPKWEVKQLKQKKTSL